MLKLPLVFPMSPFAARPEMTSDEPEALSRNVPVRLSSWEMGGGRERAGCISPRARHCGRSVSPDAAGRLQLPATEARGGRLSDVSGSRGGPDDRHRGREGFTSDASNRRGTKGWHEVSSLTDVLLPRGTHGRDRRQF